MSSAPTATPSRLLTNLPIPVNSFVGRQAELLAVGRLLSESRLLTLTGAGGIGKTRLALEVARRAVDRFPDGVWLVELAPVANRELLESVALAALGSGRRSGWTAGEALINSLSGSQMLLVLDNCEHLVEGVAQLASTVLQRCPAVRLLVTSREVLNVSGETTWRVPGMAVPDAARSLTFDELRCLEAVQLFLQRAGAARPGFEVTPEMGGAIGRICRRLDGIPLAIELAAARVRTIPITVIDERLADHTELLTTSSRTAPPRQRTLQATLDWSYALLTPAEQRLFHTLAVFRGGFTLEAAEQTCGPDQNGTTTAPSVIEGLSSLIDKSLALLEEVGDRPARYRLLEPVRDYAWDRLRASGEGERIERRHALYYLDLAEEKRATGPGPDRAWYAWAAAELDNLRAAFEWQIANDAAAALRLALALKRHWMLSEGGEGRVWLRRGLEASTELDERRAEALWTLSFWATFSAEPTEGRELADEALRLAQELGSRVQEGYARQALALSASLGGKEACFPLFEEAEAATRRGGDRWALALLLNNYGYTLFEAGDLELARAKLLEAAEISETLQDEPAKASVSGSLAGVELARGDRAAAEAGWRRELETVQGIGDNLRASEALSGLARLALDAGQSGRSVQLLGAATEAFRRGGSRMYSPNLDLIAEAQRRAREVIGPELTEAAWARGIAMSLEDAARFALQEPMANESAAGRSAPPPSSPPTTENAFIRHGDLWTVSFAGTSAHLRDSKGLRDLARLLGSPGLEIAAVDLADAGMPAPGAASVDRALREQSVGVETDAGPLVDAEARSQYRQRLADLEEDLRDAEAANDPERASRIREEREFLLAELRAAVGLGGRERRALDPAERARKAVAGRIRDAIDHIEAAHAALATHLRRSVRTGAFCVYDPVTPTVWLLRATRSDAAAGSPDPL